MWFQLHIIVIQLDEIHNRPSFLPRTDHPERSRVIERLFVDVEKWEDVRVYQSASTRPASHNSESRHQDVSMSILQCERSSVTCGMKRS
jgi:hypothetical protein